jgi:hypothetical protein
MELRRTQLQGNVQNTSKFFERRERDHATKRLIAELSARSREKQLNLNMR